MIEFVFELVMFAGSMIVWTGGITVISLVLGTLLMTLTNKRNNMMHEMYVVMYDSFKEEMGDNIKTMLMTLWVVPYITILYIVAYPFVSAYYDIKSKH